MPNCLPRLLLLTILAWSPVAFAQQAPLRRIGSSDQSGTSQAVVVGNVPLVHTSQVLAWDDRGRIAEGNAAAQARQVLDNLERRLGDAQSSLKQIVKLNVYAANEDAAAAAL